MGEADLEAGDIQHRQRDRIRRASSGPNPAVRETHPVHECGIAG
jgi:hypothetical protein